MVDGWKSEERKLEAKEEELNPQEVVRKVRNHDPLCEQLLRHTDPDEGSRQCFVQKFVARFNIHHYLYRHSLHIRRIPLGGTFSPSLSNASLGDGIYISIGISSEL